MISTLAHTAPNWVQISSYSTEDNIYSMFTYLDRNSLVKDKNSTLYTIRTSYPNGESAYHPDIIESYTTFRLRCSDVTTTAEFYNDYYVNKNKEKIIRETYDHKLMQRSPEILSQFKPIFTEAVVHGGIKTISSIAYPYVCGLK